MGCEVAATPNGSGLLLPGSERQYQRRDHGRRIVPAEKLLTQHTPAIVIIELGANDGLRGLALEHLRENLAAIIETSRAHDAKVLLLPMRLPENYGQAFTRRFRAVYEDLSKEYALPASPFILQGFVENPRFMQEDGIHPKREAQSLMLDNIWPSLQPLL